MPASTAVPEAATSAAPRRKASARFDVRRHAGAARAQERPVPWALGAIVVLVLAGAVVLRFWVRSDLWLDEAQTAAIAGRSLTQIPAALRHDGAPPLYYLLLHVWMRAFGTSDLAVRSLAGVFGTISLPLAWMAGRRLGARAEGVPGSRLRGRSVGWAMLLVLATLPFAIRFSTENRMYSLVIVLVLAGYLLLESALVRPTIVRLVALAITAGLLALTQYWCLYLLAATAAVLLWLTFRSARGVAHVGPRRCLLALVLGTAALFGPWVPTFLYQLHHTGTPWAPPGTMGDLGWIVSGYSGLGTGVVTGLAQLVSFLLVGLALFGLLGRRQDGGRIEVDLRGRGAARPIAFVFVATLVVGLLASQLTNSAYAPR